MQWRSVDTLYISLTCQAGFLTIRGVDRRVGKRLERLAGLIQIAQGDSSHKVKGSGLKEEVNIDSLLLKWPIPFYSYKSSLRNQKVL